MVFLYNSKTKNLHIKDYCRFTKGIKTDYIEFASEKDVLAYDGRAVSLCKLCERKRDKIEKENLK